MIIKRYFLGTFVLPSTHLIFQKIYFILESILIKIPFNFMRCRKALVNTIFLYILVWFVWVCIHDLQLLLQFQLLHRVTDSVEQYRRAKCKCNAINTDSIKLCINFATNEFAEKNMDGEAVCIEIKKRVTNVSGHLIPTAFFNFARELAHKIQCVWDKGREEGKREQFPFN